MKAMDTNTKLIDSYIALLKNLSVNNKLDIIAKLTQSIKSDSKSTKDSFNKSFGAWDKNDDAKELVLTIRNSRNINRKISRF
jgi:hypothetical protein